MARPSKVLQKKEFLNVAIIKLHYFGSYAKLSNFQIRVQEFVIYLFL